MCVCFIRTAGRTLHATALWIGTQRLDRAQFELHPSIVYTGWGVTCMCGFGGFGSSMGGSSMVMLMYSRAASVVFVLIIIFPFCSFSVYFVLYPSYQFSPCSYQVFQFVCVLIRTGRTLHATALRVGSQRLDRAQFELHPSMLCTEWCDVHVWVGELAPACVGRGGCVRPRGD